MPDSSKPYSQIIAFAGALGWRGLQMWQHDLDGRIITFYATTDPKFFLQVNEHPVGCTVTHVAAVYAHRYGICTGWHVFNTTDRDASHRLAEWLRRSQFRDAQWRRSFKRRHPECCGDPRDWPPSFPDDSKPPI